MSLLTHLASRAGSAAQAAYEAGQNLFEPSVRLGITGLSRSGKTVFTAAVVHHLIGGTRLPAFRPAAEGRIRRARLAHQPDYDVPRFPYEATYAALAEQRHWPASTSRISELRLDLEFERGSRWRSGPGRLSLDIVDYPGEWLLDLALIGANYRDWSRETVAAARRPDRAALARDWLTHLATLEPSGRADEAVAAAASDAFRTYLLARRSDPEAVATTPPGRFLMPGDLAGSPALTFAPLDLGPDAGIASDSLAGVMERRFESYKARVVAPFFREHFQRLDRQIVLVDVLAAIDAGPAALAELENALDRVLLAFNAGRNTLLSRLFSPRADRVLFAATKADHIHHTSHDRLERALRLLVSRAAARTEAAGARVGTVALASVRATREGTVRQDGAELRTVIGTPEAGEQVGDEIFDGETDAAIYPGELPADPTAILRGAVEPGSFRFPRFRPPRMPADPGGRPVALPHIRLDRALDFLLSDRIG